MENSDCSKKKIKKIKDRLKDVLPSLKEAFLAAVHKLGQLLCAFVNAELALLEPLFAVQKVIVETFVVAPLHIAASAAQSVSSTISTPMNALELDTTCPDTNKAVKAVKKTVEGIETTANKFQTWSNGAAKWIEEHELHLENLRVSCENIGQQLQEA